MESRRYSPSGKAIGGDNGKEGRAEGYQSIYGDDPMGVHFSPAVILSEAKNLQVEQSDSSLRSE